MTREELLAEMMRIICQADNTKTPERNYITAEEMSRSFLPEYAIKRLCFHVNHSGLKASGRINRLPIWRIDTLEEALKWQANKSKRTR